MSEHEATHTVGQLADLARVTVRTLHHYDERGLLRSTARTSAGYRIYSDLDAERLFRILAYRELGFSLDDIASILDDPGRTAADHLREQYKLLKEQSHRLSRMLTAIETAMEAEDMGISLTPEEKFELFGDWLPDDYAEEAERRWGRTDQYQQSQERAARYTKDDWLQIKIEADELNRRLADLVTTRADAEGDSAMSLAEDHRQHIIRWFNDVPYPMHRGMAQMYVEDERFAGYYEAVAPGGATFMRRAIEANAERHCA